MKNKVLVGKSKIKGKGVFALKDIKKGEKVIIWHPKKAILKEEIKKLSKEDKNHSTYAGNGKYLIMGENERFVNHSCNPNTFVHNKKDIALKDIKKGDEITSDYSINGVDDWKMKCKCGNKNCRRIIFGNYFKLSPKLQIKYFPFLENWFKKEFKYKLKKI